MMGTKSSRFLFSILLLLLNSSSITSSAHEHHHHHHRNSAMDFLNSMAETQRGESIEGISKLKKHLSNLGYIENDINLESSSSSSSPIHDDLFDETLEEAVVKYQSFFKLPPTGILDATTLAHMQKPRCGIRDVFHHHLNTSAKYSFFPGEPKWPAGKRLLSYSFPAGERKDLVEAIREAGDIWAGVSPFKFTYTADYDKADIKISLQTRDHGDGSPFDGRAGPLLAHAFPPPDGRLHFDNDERWVNGRKRKHFDFQTVGLHELGHILGLHHSTDGSAIMYPTINIRTRKGLGHDDVEGIRALYPSG